MLNDAVITPITAQDFDHVYALERAAHAFPWSEAVVRQSLANKYQRWALWQQQQLLGMAFFQIIRPEAELLNLAIAPRYQGQGLGRFFLKSLLQQLQVQGVERCFLEVRASNLSAIRLYEGLGFNQMGQRHGYYPTKEGREDAYLYALEWSVGWMGECK